MNEFDLINTYFRVDTRSTELGVGDDAAIIRPTPGMETYVAVDTLINGVHFPKRSPAASVGYRALAVNLSDLAAMGATPRWATIALSLPELDHRWVADFIEGFQRLADEYGIDLIGGDTTKGPLSVTVQAMGEAPRDTRLVRSAGQPGDDIYLTGSVGDAAAGLRLLKSQGGAENDHQQYLVDRFLWPTPRLGACGNLRAFANAVIDVSDGLLADISHIANASNLKAVVEKNRLPRSEALTQEFSDDDAFEFALCGGDDYELVFSAPTAARAHLKSADCTRIGILEPGSGIELLADGLPIAMPAQLGYEHGVDSPS